MNSLVDLEAKVVQSANWGSILSARDLLCGVKPTSRYDKIYVEPYNPQFVARQFGLTQHFPMAFGTMTSPTSCPSLYANEVNKTTELTQWMLNLFKSHLFFS